MALNLLASGFTPTYKALDDPPTETEINLTKAGDNLVYIKGIGFMLWGEFVKPNPLQRNASDGYIIMQLDGVAYSRTFRIGRHEGIMPDAVDKSRVTRVETFFNRDITTVDPFTGGVETVLIPGSLPGGVLVRKWIRVADRFIAFSVNKVYTMALDNTEEGGVTVEYTFSSFTGSNAEGRNISVGNGSIIYVNGATEMVQYDYILKTEVGVRTRALPTGAGATSVKAMLYLWDLDIFFSVDNTNEIAIWANSYEPTNLSVPVMSPVAEEGIVSRVSTILTGDLSEPVEGEVVSFAITSGPGRLETDNAVTDATGKAEMRYICPPGSSGDVTVSVSINV
ncbi:MAG: hypothetical protein KAJ03_04450 [Gammaproteobacteria bacterium]|nr:hypothetical protein [Gammaproteobacteria bacterium]